MDSRHYIFAFQIGSLAEAPEDFAIPADLQAIDAGVFLPAGREDSRGRKTYPARILLLAGRELTSAAHPAAGERSSRLPLGKVESIESGRSLLLGWVVFCWDGGCLRLPYNAGAGGSVEDFLAALKDRWLPVSQNPPPAPPRPLGQPLDLKFGAALSAELLPGEKPVTVFFHPAVRRAERVRFRRRVAWDPGNLLVLTTRRLLWITERRDGCFERYGTVSRSAPLDKIAGARCLRGENGTELDAWFASGHCWRVPLGDVEARESLELEAAVRRFR